MTAILVLRAGFKITKT